MVQKIVAFDVALKSTERQWVQKVPEVYTNDLGSVTIQFKVTDCTDVELTNSTAIVLLKMRDGSFFKRPSVDVTRTRNVFSYTLKENEGNHDGLAEIQLIVTIDAKEFASQKYNFKVITGLDSEVAREIMIYDWSTLTAEARAYIDQFTADEVLRDAEFDNAQFDRNAAFNAAQTQRVITFNASEAARATEYDAKADKVQEAWITPTLLNGFTSDVVPLRYKKDSLGFVHIQGQVENMTTVKRVFVLPVGYRPDRRILFSHVSDLPGINYSLVDSTGGFTYVSGGFTWADFGEIIFYVG